MWNQGFQVIIKTISTIPFWIMRMRVNQDAYIDTRGCMPHENGMQTLGLQAQHKILPRKLYNINCK